MERDQSDGCLRGHTVHHKNPRPIIEPTNYGCKELVENEMKLKTNFIETSSTNVLVKCDQSVLTHKLLDNLETSDDESDTRSGEVLHIFSPTQQ